jgi:putative DNA primase/helicase
MVSAASRPISQLSDSELRAAKARAARELRRAAGLTALMEPISEIKTRPLRWLWPGRIPLGKLTIIAVDPGLGKSLLTLDLAARVSKGSRLPDDERAEQGDSIIISAEDDAGDTIRPRLEVAGADLTRIHILHGVHRHGGNGDAKIRDFCLVDVEALDDALDSIDDISNSEVRGALRPLAELAARRGVSILGVSHLRKGQSPVAIYRITGFLAFTAAARAVYAVVRDPEDRARRLFLPVKCNLGPDMSGLAYRIEGGPDGVPFLHWDQSPVEQQAETLLGEPQGEPRSELEEAADWLRDVLAEGPRLAVDLQRQAREAGISWITIRRAKRQAGAVSRRQGTVWVWTLQDAQGAQDSHGEQQEHLEHLDGDAGA